MALTQQVDENIPQRIWLILTWQHHTGPADLLAKISYTVWSSYSTTSKRCSSWFRFGDYVGYLSTFEHRGMLSRWKKPSENGYIVAINGWTLSATILQVWHQVWFSAAGTDLFQKVQNTVCSETLHILLVTQLVIWIAAALLSAQYSLAIYSWPLAPTRELLLTGYFLYFCPFSVNRSCVEIDSIHCTYFI